MPIDQQTIEKHLKLAMPIVINGVVWDGRPHQYSNLPNNRLSYSQKFGMRPQVYKQFGLAGHNGVDIAGNIGTPIVAPCRIFITMVYDGTEGYGKHIWAETESITENGETFKIELVFGHFDSIVVKPFRWYDAGALLGLMGNTGFSTGPHLHLGIRPWLKISDSKWEYLFKNEYRGYIDPEPYMPYMVWDWAEVINSDNNMEVEKFLKEHDLRLVRNSDTGEVGWIYAGKLRTIPEWNKLPRSEMFTLTYLHRTQNGVTVHNDFWEKLPEENF